MVAFIKTLVVLNECGRIQSVDAMNFVANLIHNVIHIIAVIRNVATDGNLSQLRFLLYFVEIMAVN